MGPVWQLLSLRLLLRGALLQSFDYLRYLRVNVRLPHSARATRRRHSARSAGCRRSRRADVGADARGLATVFEGLGGVGHEAWLDFTKPVLPPLLRLGEAECSPQNAAQRSHCSPADAEHHCTTCARRCASRLLPPPDSRLVIAAAATCTLCATRRRVRQTVPA